MNYSQGDPNPKSIEVTKPFYFWGLYPNVQIVDVDREFEAKGFSRVSELKITEIKTTNKILWMALTFGMYYPQTYNLVSSTN
mgnify:CR=1 FL=1